MNMGILSDSIKLKDVFDKFRSRRKNLQETNKVSKHVIRNELYVFIGILTNSIKFENHSRYI